MLVNIDKKNTIQLLPKFLKMILKKRVMQQRMK